MRLALLLTVIVFLVTLLVRLPARAALVILPARVACETPAGTVWNGSCEELRVGGARIAGLSWTLHPWPLLRLHLAADVAAHDPAASGQGRLDLAPHGALSIQALGALVALPGGFGPLPGGASGVLQLAIDSARLESGHVVALQGHIELQQLRLADPPAELGSFELQFPPPTPGAPLLGQLRDLSGPLSVVGVVTLGRDGGYDLEGSIAAKSDPDGELANLLQLLGPPDAQGRHVFSIAGTL